MRRNQGFLSPAGRSMCCCMCAAGTEVEPANVQPSPSERVTSHSGTKQMQEPSQASALGCSQDVFKGWMRSCRADVHPWQRLSHTVVYGFAFSALARKDAHFLHTVWWRRDWTWPWWYFLTDISKAPSRKQSALLAVQQCPEHHALDD